MNEESPARGRESVNREGPANAPPVLDLPCDDLHCDCCHPEERHSCPGPYADSGESWTCPECGVTWTRSYERPRYWPVDAPTPLSHWRADRAVPRGSEIAARRSGGA